MPHLLFIPLMLAAFAVLAASRPSFAQADMPVSQCQMIARSLPSFTFAGLSGAPVLKVQSKADEEVRITYVGHSTFFIETPAGVKIATDYSGWYKPPVLPTVVTMNKAHSSHYTMTPESGIDYVLHGWEEGTEKGADHDVVVGDTYIRNVPTDIRNWGGTMEPNGNSIFIFEVAGLCIGHLGHLHHELTEKQYAEIGRLDVLMVPVDGGLTMGAESMSRVVKRLRSALILPMHRRGPPIGQFLSMFGKEFDAVADDDATITVSIRNLPKRSTIHILSGV
jgi:L-ascorbate metabolism protein UlaG (beta-lactamase superfamily)